MGLIISDEYFPAPKSKAAGNRSHGVSKTLPQWAKNTAVHKNPAKMVRAIPERDVSRFTLKDAAYSFLMGALSPLLFVSSLFSGCNGGRCSGTHKKLWTQQQGTAKDDVGHGVAVDKDGNIYVTGSTEGDLDGNKSAGGGDIFLTKYDPSGNKIWTKQVGCTMWDSARGIAVDASGDIYLTGMTEGDLDGNKNAGGGDIFLMKYDSSGTKLWTKQMGTASEDDANGIVVDKSGNVYVAGITYGDLDGNKNAGTRDIFLIKCDSSGKKLWTKQMGTTNSDNARGVAIDENGNIYVTGTTEGDLDGNKNAGGGDIFLIKFDSSGNKLWTKQMGMASDDDANGLVVDRSGNIYVTGSTNGGLDGNKNVGMTDIFLTKYDSSGTKLWTKQMGTASDEGASDIIVDENGNIYVTGNTVGDLDGNKNAGYRDIFLIKCDSSGKKLWTEQMGTASDEGAGGLVVDKNGSIYVTGITKGDLDGNKNAGGSDIFLTKFACE